MLARAAALALRRCAAGGGPSPLQLLAAASSQQQQRPLLLLGPGPAESQGGGGSWRRAVCWGAAGSQGGVSCAALLAPFSGQQQRGLAQSALRKEKDAEIDEANFKAMREILPQGAGLSDEEIRSIAKMEVRKGTVQKMVKWMKDKGCTSEDIVMVIKSYPRFMGCAIPPIDTNVKNFKKLGLTEKRIHHIIRKAPRVLCLKAENIQSKFLLEKGLTQGDVARLVGRNPQFLGLSIPDNIEPTIEFLEEQGMPQENVISLLSKNWSIVLLSIDKKLKKTLAALEELGCTKEEVRNIVATYPRIFLYSVDNIIATWKYLQEEGYSHDEIIEFPRALSYSLDSRIRPRLSFIVHRGRRFKLSALLCKPDEDFPKTIGASTKEYNDFRAGLASLG